MTALIINVKIELIPNVSEKQTSYLFQRLHYPQDAQYTISRKPVMENRKTSRQTAHQKRRSSCTRDHIGIAPSRDQ